MLSSANSSVGVFRLGGRDQGSFEATDGGGTEAGVGETLTGAHGSAGMIEMKVGKTRKTFH